MDDSTFIRLEHLYQMDKARYPSVQHAAFRLVWPAYRELREEVAQIRYERDSESRWAAQYKEERDAALDQLAALRAAVPSAGALRSARILCLEEFQQGSLRSAWGPLADKLAMLANLVEKLFPISEDSAPCGPKSIAG